MNQHLTNAKKNLREVIKLLTPTFDDLRSYHLETIPNLIQAGIDGTLWSEEEKLMSDAIKSLERAQRLINWKLRKEHLAEIEKGATP